jgi:hypothetical protein
MTERLVAQVKRKLNITWNDDDTTNRVQDIIQSAIPALKHKLGIADPDFDFGTPGMENDLFKAYCLYEFNHCLNEFDANYANDILQVRAKHEVEDYLANEVVDGE